jgi:hypothetical protein
MDEDKAVMVVHTKSGVVGPFRVKGIQDDKIDFCQGTTLGKLRQRGKWASLNVAWDEGVVDGVVLIANAIEYSTGDAVPKPIIRCFEGYIALSEAQAKKLNLNTSVSVRRRAWREVKNWGNTEWPHEQPPDEAWVECMALV